MALHRYGCYVDAMWACIHISIPIQAEIYWHSFLLSALRRLELFHYHFATSASCHLLPQYRAEKRGIPREQAGDLSLFTSVMGRRKEGNCPEDVFAIVACELPDIFAMTHRSTLFHQFDNDLITSLRVSYYSSIPYAFLPATFLHSFLSGFNIT
ncbi:hypothetical protein WUBG_00067 [Wuchereria bancrofti]|uniref:Uncharacterized protein n=1 Tax=Wuchereria bancrofti TaxID=6293 RepID=J9FHC7_WUCBA|nr:hypothetical protein WUBG_00067 [Wuchereria bancrofti]